MQQEFFDDWHGKYKTASIATSDRQEQIAEVAKLIEVRYMECMRIHDAQLLLLLLLLSTFKRVLFLCRL